VEDTGVITIGPYKYPNWFWLQYGKTDGLLNIVTALKRSNDIYFYKVGEWVGVEKLAQWAGKMGVGKILGIDLPGEAAGVMPTPEWRKKTRGDEWYLGDTYHLAIGQGDLQVTPLQANFWTNVIANGGKLCRPTLLKNQDCKDLGLKKETIGLIKEGMKEACSTGGTGWPFFEFKVQSSEFGERKISVACKTGTAEYGDPQNKTHAWFTVFAPLPAEKSAKAAPADEPELTITVLVEGGGEGSNVAAPIAKKILEEWFNR
ncbi:penicillin-binding transpeptidase domain-containing protein, partial [Patescibacteria group bacterium]|nr:penicillin-binding transpeptidase domain-containing protein [Patescibacteria group bacterium]